VFPLTLHVTGAPGPAGIVCQYRLGSFAPEVARQFALHVAQMHRQVLAGPDCPAATAELLDAGERARIAALGRPARPLQTNPVRVHDLVRVGAMARPDAPAVSDGKQRISYAELDERSDQVAHGLRALGIADGDRVGTCLERSAELVITLLGVLKAGAVYVPMDPAYPADRLSYTARDAGLRVVIGTPGEFPACPGVRVITAADVADLSEASRPGPPARTPPMSSTRPARPGAPRGSSSRTPTSWRSSTRPVASSSSASPTCGACSTPVRSTSRSGRSGAAC
jgi:non-ribosomal peptide synthetase component F